MQEYLDNESPNAATWQLNRDLRSVMDRYARRERAAWIGYDPEDEQFYGSGLIGMIMPSVVDGSAPKPELGDNTKRSGDPAEAGEWEAMVADVKSALESLTDRQRFAVTRHYGFGDSQGTIGKQLGITQQSVSSLLAQAIKKMQRALGGTRPHACAYDCECQQS
jgi:RNA polymerase sigma factor (sigma-70 family)